MPKGFMDALNQTADTASNFLTQFVGGDAVENYTKYVAGSDAPITEQTIDADMLEALRGAASHSLARGRDTLSYNDYQKGASREVFKSGNTVLDSINKLSNPSRNAMLTLGEAQLKQHDGNLYASDVYDFNNAREDWDGVQKGIDEGIDPLVLGMEYLASKVRPYTSDNSGLPTMVNLGKLSDFGSDGSNIGSAMDYYEDAVNKGLIPNNPLSAIAPTEKEAVVAQPKAKSIKVKPGQTLSGIARRLGTSPDNLAQLNSIEDPSKIFAGQNLKY